MRFAQIREIDIANGPGVRMSLYVQGCHRHCPHCFNQETWDFNGGNPWDEEAKKQFFTILKRPHIKGVTILGGEPLEAENRKDVLALLKEIRQRTPDKTIWLYSSFMYEEIVEFDEPILEELDVLVDGPFIEALKDTRLRFKGSSNQRIIDCQKSIQDNQIVLYEESVFYNGTL